MLAPILTGIGYRYSGSAGRKGFGTGTGFEKGFGGEHNYPDKLFLKLLQWSM